MRTSDKIDLIAPALSEAQTKLTNPKRNRAVTVKTKTGGSYEYSYATLDTIFDLIRPVLTETHLAVTQGTQRNLDGWVLTTRITHSSGQFIETDTPLPYSGTTDAQVLGSALSYAKRYGLTAALGVTSEEDDDGRATAEKKGVHRPADGAGERLDEPTRNRMADIATAVQDLANGDKWSEAFAEWEKSGAKVTDADAKVYAWDLLPSKTRSTLKRMKRDQLRGTA